VATIGKSISLRGLCIYDKIGQSCVVGHSAISGKVSLSNLGDSWQSKHHVSAAKELFHFVKPLMVERRAIAELLASAGRLLLEYNESTGNIHRSLTATASALTRDKLEVSVHYGGVLISIGDDPPEFTPIKELRYNATLQARVHSILDDVRRGKLDVASALAKLQHAETTTPRHPRAVAVVVLGIAAAALAAILGADWSAILTVGISSALGLFARQELGRRHFALLTLPLVAAFLGAVFGGIAIRMGWTYTPALVLVVPSLMLVPGPHLINGLLDLMDNYLPMSLARLGLATSILTASALGIVLGMELTIFGPAASDQSFGTAHLNLISDMFLAGVVTCGFAMFYNASWPQIGMAIAGGMIGHGLRYVALEAGCRLEVATFVGSIAVGVIAAFIARNYKTPFAVIAFAGAVTMMPGLQMYRALGGALQLAHTKTAAESSLVAGALGNALQASFTVAALALGLVLGLRIISIFTRKSANVAVY